jgi:hypothetical protein
MNKKNIHRRLYFIFFEKLKEEQSFEKSYHLFIDSLNNPTLHLQYSYLFLELLRLS